MSDKTTKAERDLPRLRTFTDQATQLGRSMLEQKIPIDYPTDHFGVMCLFIASKQLAGMESIRLLVDDSNSMDASLITRSMLEGLARLKWVSGSREERALRWRSFSLVEGHARMIDREDSGSPPPEESVRPLLERLETEGLPFLTTAAKKAKAAGRKLPRRPYVHDWITTQSIFEVFSEVKAVSLYKIIYAEASRWSHCTLGSFSDAIEVREGSIQFNPASTQLAATCLASGFQALIECLFVADEYFNLGRSAQLLASQGEYLNAFTDSQP